MQVGIYVECLYVPYSVYRYFKGIKLMFTVFADQACTTKIYTHEFNIACCRKAAMLQKGCYSANVKSVSNGHSAKFIPSKYTC